MMIGERELIYQGRRCGGASWWMVHRWMEEKMTWSITKVDGGNWVARQFDQIRARISFRSSKCTVEFTGAPELKYEFAMNIGCDEMLLLERAIGYVRGIERAVHVARFADDAAVLLRRK
jgi:hypothetical protein